MASLGENAIAKPNGKRSSNDIVSTSMDIASGGCARRHAPAEARDSRREAREVVRCGRVSQ